MLKKVRLRVFVLFFLAFLSPLTAASYAISSIVDGLCLEYHHWDAGPFGSFDDGDSSCRHEWQAGKFDSCVILRGPSHSPGVNK